MWWRIATTKQERVCSFLCRRGCLGGRWRRSSVCCGVWCVYAVRHRSGYFELCSLVAIINCIRRCILHPSNTVDSTSRRESASRTLQTPSVHTQRGKGRSQTLTFRQCCARGLGRGRFADDTRSCSRRACYCPWPGAPPCEGGAPSNEACGRTPAPLPPVGGAWCEAAEW